MVNLVKQLRTFLTDFYDIIGYCEHVTRCVMVV